MVVRYTSTIPYNLIAIVLGLPIKRKWCEI